MEKRIKGTNDFDLVTDDGDISLTPGGTGKEITIDGLKWPQADGTTDYVLKTDGAGQLSWTTNVSGGLNNIVEDTTPQLGGSLDVNGQSIVSAAAGDIAITPDTTGDVILDGLKWPQADGTASYYLQTNGAGQLSWAAGGAGLSNVVEDTTPQLGGSLDVNGQSIVSITAGDIAITPDTTGDVVLDGLKWPQADGTADYVLKTDGVGQLSWVAQSGGAVAMNDLTDVTITAAAKGDILVYNGSAWVDLTVGTNDQVLTADSVEATGVKWSTAAGGLTYWADNYSGTAPTATGAGSLAIGDVASAAGPDSIVIGSGASDAGATGGYSVVIGCDAGTIGTTSEQTVVGRTANACPTGTAIGSGSKCEGTGLGTVALGRRSIASGAGAISIGINNTGATYGAKDDNAIAIGVDSYVESQKGIAIGNGARAGKWDGSPSVAIGQGSLAYGSDNVILGVGCETGPTDTTDVTRSIGIGKNINADANYTITMGYNLTNTATNSVYLVGGILAGGSESGLHCKDGGNLTLIGDESMFIQPSYATGSLPTGTTGGTVYDSTSKVVKVYDGSSWKYAGDVGYIHLQHKTAWNTGGGSYTSGWTTRPMTNEITDTGGDCTLTTNEFTLLTGTYEIEYRGKHAVDATGESTVKCRLYNVTDTAVELLGSEDYIDGDTGKQTDLHLHGRFTIAASKALRIEHICSDGFSNGFGRTPNVDSTWGDCIHADVVIKRIA